MKTISKLHLLAYILLIALLAYLPANANDYIYNKYDGKSFGADGMPSDCNSQRYQSDNFFAGNGRIFCEFAKEIDQTVMLTTLTATTAVILKQGAFCGMKLSALGSESLNFMSENYPVTWSIVRSIVFEDSRWGQLTKDQCSLVKLSDSGGIFQ